MPRWPEKTVYRRGRTCVFLHVHRVSVTERRRHVLAESDIAFLRQHFGEVAALQAVRLVEMNDEDDHVHLLLE